MASRRRDPTKLYPHITPDTESGRITLSDEALMLEIAAIKMRDKARRKLHKAEQMCQEKVDEIVRTSRQLAMWQKRVRYYARQSAKSDADLQTERERRLAQKESRRSTFRRIRR